LHRAPLGGRVHHLLGRRQGPRVGRRGPGGEALGRPAPEEARRVTAPRQRTQTSPGPPPPRRAGTARVAEGVSVHRQGGSQLPGRSRIAGFPLATLAMHWYYPCIRTRLNNRRGL